MGYIAQAIILGREKRAMVGSMTPPAINRMVGATGSAAGKTGGIPASPGHLRDKQHFEGFLFCHI